MDKCYLDNNGNVKLRLTQGSLIVQNDLIMYPELLDLDPDHLDELANLAEPTYPFRWEKLPLGVLPIESNRLYISSLDKKGAECYWMLARCDEPFLSNEPKIILEYIKCIGDLASLQKDHQACYEMIYRFLLECYFENQDE